MYEQLYFSNDYKRYDPAFYSVSAKKAPRIPRTSSRNPFALPASVLRSLYHSPSLPRNKGGIVMIVSITGSENGYLSISLPYDPKLIDAMHKVADSRWDKIRKVFRLPDNKGNVRQLLKALYDTGLFSAIEVDPLKKIDLKELFVEPCRQAAPDPQAPYLQRYLAALSARHYSDRTKESYEKWLRRFLESNKEQSPKNLGGAEINTFLSRLAVTENVSASTQNQALAALLFFFRNVMNIPVGDVGEVIRAKNPNASRRDEQTGSKGSPIRPQRRQMACGISHVRYRHQDNGMPRTPRTGHRFSRNEILIRNGKGAKDRVTMLPETLKKALCDHLAQVKIIHDKDLAEGWGRVPIPNALEKKYPNASTIGHGNGSSRRNAAGKIPQPASKDAITWTRASCKAPFTKP